MTAIRLAKDLTLPVDLVTQTVGVVAKKRSGKSYFARRLTEQLHKAKQQVVVVDPKGDWWGLLSSTDGKGPGLPFVIVGGERGHVPLEPNGGEVVAKLVVEERVSTLLDLSLLRKHEVATFMTAFLESLYRMKAVEQFRTPVMLVIDEADAIAPQKPQPNELRMLGAASDIVRRGGQRGIGCTMVTQRTAVLNKDVLTQVQMLVALRTISPQDLGAMNAWIDVHGSVRERQQLMASLPSLPIGDAWVWSPGWPTDDGIFKRIHTAPIETFDSGATPKPGERRVEPKNLAEVNLDAVRAQMAETIERAKQDDPKELRRRIAELEQQLRAKPPRESKPPKPVRVPIIDAKAQQLLRRVAKQIAELEKRIPTEFAKVHVVDPMSPPLKARLVTPRERVAVAEVVPFKPVERAQGAAPDVLGVGERKVLAACAQYGEVDRTQLTVLTGYKRRTRDTYLQRLRAKNLIEEQAGRIRATQVGVAELGDDFERLPDGDALRAHWLERLPQGEREVLRVVTAGGIGVCVSRDEISRQTGYKRRTRDTYVQRLSARKLVTAERDGIRPSPELFG